MREYPSIIGVSKAPREHCLAFCKYDGSNIRCEWTRKRGWDKFGTRTQLLDTSHPYLGLAVPIFLNKYADEIEKVIRDTKEYRNADYVTAFVEFFGQNSFAGMHKQEDPKDVILFDIQVSKRGILGPREFIKAFGHLDIAKLVYEGVLNQTFIDAVRASLPNDGKLGLNEGVVCKGLERCKDRTYWMCKIKTWDYLARLKKMYSDGWQKFWE